MITRKTVTIATSCKRCNLNVLNAITSLAGLSFSPASKSNARILRPTIERRHFTQQSYLRQEVVQRQELQALLDDTGPDIQSIKAPNEGHISQPIPWYLQVETPRQDPRLLSNRQRLPELPLDPPPLLQPILEHISVNLGLDDLSLFDLRNLDPPPALGANLIMILGTARSEKHLHVSADRFCRWLRTEFKMSPYADGLLGRGELRLKLKRKNRRARMLNSVGSSTDDSSDDGLRNAWVCVNVGVIEDGRAPEPIDMEDVQKDEGQGFVGFSDESHGARVVVQMLTEERRDQLDLETLWGNMLARQARKIERMSFKDHANSEKEE